MDDPDTEHYRTLGFDPTQTDVTSLTAKQISSAYRKAALKHHPDKNPDDPAAAAAFSRVFLAYETLSDPARRAKYDAVIRAARQRRQRFAALDADRQRLRADLDRREAAATRERAAARDAPPMRDVLARMQREVERLRREAMSDAAAAARVQKARREGRAAQARAAGPWGLVPGFDKFRGDPGVEFDGFEQAVLDGRDPF